MNSPVCSHCLCFQCEGFDSNTGRHDYRVFLRSKGRLGRGGKKIVSLMMFVKLTIKVVAFFLGHPV